MIIDGVKVSYGIIDKTIEDDKVTHDSSLESPFANYENALKQNTKQKIAYLEKDYFLLDGSFIAPAKDTAYNVGWESSNIADEQGNITAYLEYRFAHVHDSYGVRLLLAQDSLVSDFSISYYKDSVLIGKTDVNGYTSKEYSDYNINLQWNRVRIDFRKTRPRQRARFYEIVFGINDMYDEDVLLSVTSSRTTDLEGDYDSCGDFSFSFFNEGRFNIRDVDDLPIGLQEGQTATIYYKERGSNEYKEFGTYKSNETNVEEGGRVITISGYDTLFALNDTIYSKGIVHTEGMSLYDWAVDVANDAGIDIIIDESLKNIISTGYITEVPHREALRLIAEAGTCIMTVGSGGVVEIKKHVPIDKGELTDDDIVDETMVAQNLNKYLGINVSKYTFSSAKQPQELAHLEKVLVTTEPQVLEIVYGTYPVVVGSVKVFYEASSNIIEDNVEIYSDRIVLTLHANKEVDTFITITGTPYNSAITNVTRGSVTKNIKAISGNFLITGDIATMVADHQASQVLNKSNYSAELVTSIDIDLGDAVQLGEGEKRDKIYVKKLARSMSFEDTLETIEGVNVNA